MPNGVRLLLLAALVLFLALGDTPDRTRFWVALFDFGHAPLCGVFALLVRGWIVRRDPSRHAASPLRASLYALAAALLLGIATESLQVLQAHRDAAPADLARDVAGAASFLLALEALEGRRHRAEGTGGLRWTAGRRAAALVFALLLLATAGAGLARTLTLYAERWQAFPTLFALDGSWWERELITANDSRLTPAGGADASPGRNPRLARLDLRRGTYPGLSFDEPYPDWRGYRQLVVAVFSDLDSPLPLAIRVHDAAHDQSYGDRFNRQFLVQRGDNRFVIPLNDIRTAPAGRDMDLQRIRGIILFAHALDRPAHVYVGPLRLE